MPDIRKSLIIGGKHTKRINIPGSLTPRHCPSPSCFSLFGLSLPLLSTFFAHFHSWYFTSTFSFLNNYVKYLYEPSSLNSHLLFLTVNGNDLLTVYNGQKFKNINIVSDIYYLIIICPFILLVYIYTGCDQIVCANLQLQHFIIFLSRLKIQAPFTQYCWEKCKSLVVFWWLIYMRTMFEFPQKWHNTKMGYRK